MSNLDTEWAAYQDTFAGKAAALGGRYEAIVRQAIAIEEVAVKLELVLPPESLRGAIAAVDRLISRGWTRLAAFNQVYRAACEGKTDWADA